MFCLGLLVAAAAFPGADAIWRPNGSRKRWAEQQAPDQSDARPSTEPPESGGMQLVARSAKGQVSGRWWDFWREDVKQTL